MNDTIIQVTPDVSRYRMKLIKDWISEKLGVEDPRLIGDYLRMSEKLTETRDIEIGVKSNDSADYILDKKLAQDDLFFITHLGVVISKEVDSEEGNSLMLSYPDFKIFKGAGEGKALNTLYNGKLSLNDSHDRRFYDFYMAAFLKTPNIQVNVNSNGDIIQYPNISLDEMLIEWNPFEVVSGLAMSKFNIRLGRGIYTGIGDGGKNRVNIIAKGFKGSGLAAAYNKYAKEIKG